jgi:diadenosine tetraphosphate (Ap4A) HIT family hydrolase
MDCGICAKVAQAGDTAVYEDENWIGMPSERVGWVMLAARQHAEWTWGLTEAQAASFGPAVSRISNTLRNVAGTNKVYLIGLGEAAIHCHFLLIPRIEELGADVRAALRKWGDIATDAGTSTRMANSLRAELKS